MFGASCPSDPTVWQRQRVLVSILHSVAGSEPLPTIALYCPEASLEYSYAFPMTVIWAGAFLTLSAVLFFIPFVSHLLRRPVPATSLSSE